MDGRKKLKLIPATLLRLSINEEKDIYRSVFDMTPDQEAVHRQLQKHGRIFLTQNARSGSEFHVVVRQGQGVPFQMVMGEEIVQIVVKRVDGEPEPYYWRDLQDIKDVVLGLEGEALELFPAESRRRRDLNFRVLWGMQSDDHIPLGWQDEGET